MSTLILFDRLRIEEEQLRQRDMHDAALRICHIDELAELPNKSAVKAIYAYIWDTSIPKLVSQLGVMPMLEWIHIANVGVEDWTPNASVLENVVLTNSRGIYDGPIAEYVLASLLYHLKEISLTSLDQDSKTWRRRDLDRLEGKQVLRSEERRVGKEWRCGGEARRGRRN